MKKTLLFLLLALMILPLPISASAKSSGTESMPSGIPLTELEQFVDDYAAEYIGSTTAGASIVVVKDGEIILDKVYGYADAEKGTIVTDDAVFEWGSATKLIVWTSVMQLVEQGKLDLEADIRNYLPDGFLTKLQYDTPITMYNLMHHNAGWEDCYTDLFYHSADEVPILSETLRISEPSQVWEPGAIVSYSNYGTALAGYIVELISGQPFYEYVKEHIFDVLAMNDTTIHPCQEDNLSVAARRENIHGHTLSKNQLAISENERIFLGLYPAGSTIGTAADAAKFLSALLPSEGENSPLFTSNNTLKEMLSTSYSYEDAFPGIAHGFWENYYAVTTLGHGGNTDSFSSYLAVAPQADAAIVIMTNQAGESNICSGLTNELFGTSEVTYNGTLPDAQDLEGSYIMARRAYRGFSKIYGFLQNYRVKAIDDHTIEAFEDTFTQISPYVYRSSDNFYLYFTVENGSVIRASMAYSDLLPLSGYEWFLFLATVIALAVILLYTTAALIIILISGIQNRVRKVPSSPLKKYHITFNLISAVILANNVIMFIKALQYSSHKALKFHFGINIAYLVLVLPGIFLILSNLKKPGSSKKQKVFYCFSCIVALLLALIILLWEFYR